ncbi:MAG TPA: IclR family transcriptional regulator [Acidimicrobiales bacterium]
MVPVKQVQSAARVLATFEALADHQPVGVGALARLLDDDKSAVQRALMTLAEAGWIQRTPRDPNRWEVTARVLALAHAAQRHTDLRERARPVLQALRDETDETAILNVPTGGRIVAVDVVESTQLVRAAPHIGLTVPAETSAAGQAILAHLSPDEQVPFLGEPPSPALAERLTEVRRRGWSINDQDVTPGARGVGAPVLDRGRPVGAVTISAPAERLDPAAMPALGAEVAAAVRSLWS